MDPLVQLEPEKCLLVLGPQVAAECMSNNATRVPPALSYNLLLEAGVQKMLDLENGLSTEEKIRKRALLVNAYELDPAFVGNVVVNSLKKSNSYGQWLDESFSTLANLSHSSNQFVEKLQTLQRMGMLLAYTYYDSVLDRTMGTEPILMNSEEDVSSWANHQTKGILHVHGIHTQPETLCCDCVNYEQILGATKTGQLLKELCKTKTVIFAGFDGEFFDPFMPKFSSTFVDTMPNKQPPLLLSCMAKIPKTVSFLMLKIPQISSLEKTILPISSRQAPPRESQETKRPIIATLHYSDQKSCQEAAEYVKTVSSININQLTMRHEISHELELFLDRDGLKGLWSLLFSQASQLSNGLLGLSLGSNFTVWMKMPPSLRLGMDRSPGHVTNLPPPSLSTNVSLIASMYTPIASPSVSQPASKHLTPSTRPTLPSPLVTTSSRSLLGVAKAGQLLPPELQLNPQTQAKKISQLRKAKSYYDRTDAEGARGLVKKNGLLHRESAPEFLYTSEGVFAYQPNRQSTAKPNAATGPSPLLRDGSNIELKIEYVEQPKSKKSDKKGPDFDNEKQRYIHDAKQWSRDVASRFPSKPPTTSESSVISPEEQEKMLQAHFGDKIQKSPSPLKHGNSAPRLAVSPPPLSSIPSPSRSPKFPSTKPASLQLPAIPPGVNPFLLPQSSGGSVFPFFNPGMSSDFHNNPAAMSQLAGASPLNPYHAMFQLLASQGKKPMFLSDPSVLQNLQGNVSDMLPCMFPGGQIAMIPSSVAVSSAQSEQTETESTKVSSKRARSPEMEAGKPMPKRRRSSSLPDIYHLSQGPAEESIPEEPSQNEPDSRKPRMFLGGLRPPPPSMIQLHQDAKLSMSEPVIGGFPTPQSSPCPGGFNISQFIGSPSFQHHQPMTPVTPNNEGSTEDMKDLVQAGESQTTPPPHDGSSLPPFPQGRGPIQLWQFLLDLLLSPDKQHMIQWTGNGYEFRIILPEEIAKLWGARKNKPRMNYDKLSRGLRYYYSKGIMDKVPGKKLTFKYTCDVREYIQKRFGQGRNFAATPLTPMSATPETTAGVESKPSETTSTGSVFHLAMSSPLFQTSIVDSKHTLVASTISKSPSPDSPGHVISSPGHVIPSPSHVTLSPGPVISERSPVEIKTES